jgi:hypothetical protein
MARMPIMTLSEGAELIARHAPEGTAAYYAAQARRFAQRRIIYPVGHRGHGRTATQLIDERQLMVIRLMSELVQRGIGLEEVEAASRCLNNAGPLGSPTKLKGGFHNALDTIRAGERVFFALRFGPTGDVSGGFRREADLTSFFEPFPSWNTVLVLDASKMLSPLLEYLNDLGEEDADSGATEKDDELTVAHEQDRPASRKRIDPSIPKGEHRAA